MPFILGTNSIKDTTFNVENSLRFEPDDNDHLERDPSSSGNRSTFTISFWMKLAQISTGTMFIVNSNTAGDDYFVIRMENHKIECLAYNNGSKVLSFSSNALLRDPSAWYHVVTAIDTTQGTEANRFKMYLNGSQITSWATSDYPSQNATMQWNHTENHFIGCFTEGVSNFRGYLCEIVNIDGSQLDATSFGEFDEDTPFIWKPKAVTGLTFGTNGFYLDVPGAGTAQNASGMGGDSSGNGHHFASSGLSAQSRVTDTCTNNFCTLNILSADEMTFTQGSLDVAQASDDGGGSRSDDNARGTMGVNSGKWYWEVKLTGATAPCVVGICFDELKTGFSDLSGSTGVYAIQNASTTYAYRRENGTTGETSGYPNPVANNIMNVAFDADNGKLYLGINGTYYNQAGSTGNPATGSNPTFSSIDTSFFWLPWIESRGDNQQALMNFGGGTSYSISSGNADGEGFGNFEYAVPSGYFALCTKNLAEYG